MPAQKEIAATLAHPASEMAFSASGILFGASASSGAEQPAGAFGSAMQGKAESAPAFGGGLNLFGGSSTPAFGAASAPTFGAGSAPAFGAASGSAPAFGAASGSAPTFGAALGSGPAFGGMPNFGAQSAPAFGAASAPAFGAASRAVPGTGFGFGGIEYLPACCSPPRMLCNSSEGGPNRGPCTLCILPCQGQVPVGSAVCLMHILEIVVCLAEHGCNIKPEQSCAN